MQPRKTTRHIVIHCAATQAKANIGVKEIRQWHKQRGWQDIGYHWVIRRDGRVERGRPENLSGAHEPTRNSDAVAICMAGGIDARGKPQNNFTKEQMASLRGVVRDVLTRYPGCTISGHNHWQPGRGCPSFNWRAWAALNKFKVPA